VETYSALGTVVFDTELTLDMQENIVGYVRPWEVALCCLYLQLKKNESYNLRDGLAVKCGGGSC